MAVTADEIAELRRVSADAKEMSEGAICYVYLPKLILPNERTVEALLRPGPGPDGYTTRLFLSEPVAGKGANWTIHQILDKAWHTWSWNEVPTDIRLIEILASHLGALR